MSQVEVGLLIALVIWIIVDVITVPVYIYSMRRDGLLPTVTLLLGLSVANTMEVAYFVWVAWFHPMGAYTYFALMLIPSSAIFRAFMVGGIVVRIYARRMRPMSLPSRDMEDEIA